MYTAIAKLKIRLKFLFLFPFRCHIPHQDTSLKHNLSLPTGDAVSYFLPPWLSDHIPFEQGSNLPHKCRQYAWAENVTEPLEVGCSDGFVYETHEKTILNEVSLDNNWYIYP